jgi:hypothetical protein
MVSPIITATAAAHATLHCTALHRCNYIKRNTVPYSEFLSAFLIHGIYGLRSLVTSTYSSEVVIQWSIEARLCIENKLIQGRILGNIGIPNNEKIL